MKTIAYQIEEISWLLVIIILCQSCSLYKKKPSTIEEATAKKNTRIKLTTKDGQEYKFRWIEKEDGYVYSILNTKRIYVKKKKLFATPTVQYRFIESWDEGEYIRGITMTGKDTSTVIIPIDQIEEIKLISQNKTIGLPIGIFIFLLFTFPLIAFGITAITGG